jgi:hypothetical protein
MAGSYAHGNEPLGSIKCSEFLEWLSDCRLLKKYSFPYLERASRINVQNQREPSSRRNYCTHKIENVSPLLPQDIIIIIIDKTDIFGPQASLEVSARFICSWLHFSTFFAPELSDQTLTNGKYGHKS